MNKVDIIQKMAERAPKEFNPYIKYIRFPHYKQLADNSRIDFDFPLTVLVGPNGSNKSSILRALYGCPGGNSTGNYWFSTSVDAINESSGRSCYIHGYWLESEGDIVEVLKTRIQRGDNPDYWEPSRPVKKYRMKELPPITDGKIEGRTETRWKAIEKNVVYLDFRSEIGAYDKYFWHGDLHRTKTIKSKQDYIRHKSKYLRMAIDNNLNSYNYYNKQKIQSHVLLPADICAEICKILGEEYSSVRILEHYFYDDKLGKTVILKHADLEYSEAFAGSGETAIAILVYSIMSAPAKSLILLDEPETSLHPKAQEKLQQFLLQQIMTNKHQIVMATHSPTLINGLPPEAVKVMLLNSNDRKVKIIPRSFPEAAFQIIGVTDPHKLCIFVEDELSKAIIDVYIQKYKNTLSNSINVEALSGGATSILKYFVSAAAQRRSENELYIFDGDMHINNRVAFNEKIRKQMEDYYLASGKIDPARIPEAENKNLGKFIKELTGCEIPFYINGNSENGGDQTQKYRMQRDFLTYWAEHVFFLPGHQPEELLYTNLKDEVREILFGSRLDITNIDWKSYFEEKVKLDLAKAFVTSEDILTLQRQIIAKFPEDCEVFVQIDKIIENYFTCRGRGI